MEASDAALAEELQLQEVLRASALPLQASAQELLHLQEEPMRETETGEPSMSLELLHLQEEHMRETETGEPSMSFCDLCQRKRDNQLMETEDTCVECTLYMCQVMEEMNQGYTSSSSPDALPDHQSFSPDLNTGKGDCETNEAELFPDWETGMVEDIDFDGFAGDSDDYDSDASLDSPETLKNSNRFRNFFKGLEGINIKDDSERGSLSCQWHCPACQGASGGTTRFQSLEDLLKHAKMIRTRRVKLHRTFSQLLNEELQKKSGSPLGSHGGRTLGEWIGLKDSKDFEILWPPMVMVHNTHTYQDNNNTWIGMGNEELLEQFRPYNVVKALNAYGPDGHCGMSILIFEGSVAGYLDAKYLHECFENEGRKGRVAYHEKRRLYGFLATKEDLNVFNRHYQVKCKLKYEIKTYKEAVMNPVRKMSKDSRELTRVKGKLDWQATWVTELQSLVKNLNQKLQEITTDNKILMEKMNLLCQETHEQLDFQEAYYKEQIGMLEAKVPKEDYDEDKDRLLTEEEEIHSAQSVPVTPASSAASHSAQQAPSPAAHRPPCAQARGTSTAGTRLVLAIDGYLARIRHLG